MHDRIGHRYGFSVRPNETSMVGQVALQPVHYRQGICKSMSMWFSLENVLKQNRAVYKLFLVNNSKTAYPLSKNSVKSYLLDPDNCIFLYDRTVGQRHCLLCTVFNTVMISTQFLRSTCLLITGVTRMFDFAIGNRRFKVMLPGHRTYDIYGSWKTNSKQPRHQKPISSVEKRSPKHVHRRWWDYFTYQQRS